MEANQFTKEEIKLIQYSFKTLTSKSKNAGEKFYKRLFEANPDISKLFKGDMKEQAGSLMRMVKTVVEGLNHPDIIIPAIQDLGRRHNEYGVEPEQYKIFGDCLISTVEEEMGNDFNSATKKAWEKLYILLAEEMKGNKYNQ
ncbi:MAG: globin domain-containing protein [Ignavibacteria bacterium]|jgi:hemoglobin-like flavoprotein